MNKGVIVVLPEDTDPIKKNRGNENQPAGLLTAIKSKSENKYLFIINT